MPPQLLFDISGIDLNRVLHDVEFIRTINPQRGCMEHLDGIVYRDDARREIIGYKDVRHNEFWVDGHIPGRPLLPGVIMLEAAAQLSSFYTAQLHNWTGFIGFGGLDEVRFRTSVSPGSRLYILVKQVYARHRRVCCAAQGLVDGNIVFEAKIIGAQM